MKYILAITLLAFSLQVSAQEFKAGIRFGGVGSQVNGDGLEGFDKAGVLVGAFVKRDFSEKFSMMFEMTFVQKGSRMPTNDYNQYYLMRLGYIEVPVLFIYHVNKKLGFHATPSFGFLISNHEETEMGEITEAPDFKKFEFAGNAGILYGLSDNWTFDFRYSHSITTIRPYLAGYTSFFDKGQYNVALEASLMYMF
jgi:opacity protein-like surface antigen